MAQHRGGIITCVRKRCTSGSALLVTNRYASSFSPYDVERGTFGETWPNWLVGACWVQACTESSDELDVEPRITVLWVALPPAVNWKAFFAAATRSIWGLTERTVQ